MKIEKVCTVVGVVLGSFADLWYCYQAYRGEISPKLAMWFIFCIGVTLSLVTFIQDERRRGAKVSFWTNPLNWADSLNVWGVLFFLVLLPKPDMSINRFDVICLVWSLASCIVWKLTRSAKIGNLMIQVIMVAAYFPTFNKLLAGGKNTESFVLWGATLVTVTLFSVGSIVARKTLSMVYVARAFVCVVCLLGVMVYLQFV